MSAQTPFPGPTPFALRDPRYRGDARPTRAIAASVLGSRLLILHGRSGVGKSSLMRAAVLPILEQRYACRVVCVDAWLKDGDPAERLAGALGELVARGGELGTLEATLERAWRRAASPLVLLLDQLEPLFDGRRDRSYRTAFLRAVKTLATHPGGRVHVVLSAREEVRGALERGLDELVVSGTLRARRVSVPPLTVAELTRAALASLRASGPGAGLGEDELKQLVLATRTPGAPADEDAPVEAVWAQLELRRRWSGDASGAAASPVESTRRYVDWALERASITGADAEAARAALEEELCSESGARQRAPLASSRLSPEARDALAQAGVVHVDGDAITLAHDWLAGQLATLRRIRDEERGRLTAEQMAQREHARAESRARLTRLLWVALLGLGAGALLLLVVTVGSLWSASSARGVAEQRASEVAEQRARAERAESERDAVQREIKVVTRRADLATGATFRGLLDPEGEDYSPDVAARLLLTLPEDQRPGSWREVASAALSAATREHEGAAAAVAWSVDGRRLLTGGVGGARLIPGLGGEPVATLAHDAPVRITVFSLDGARALTVAGASAKLWDARGGEATCTHEQGAPITRAVLDPAGRFAVTGAEDGGVTRWSCDGEPRSLAGFSAAITSLSLSGDGARVAAAAEGGPKARWWSTEGDEQGTYSSGETSALTVAGYGPFGKWFAAGTEGGLLHLWVAEQQYPLESFDGHDGAIRDLNFAPGGEKLVTAGDDERAIVRAIPSGRKTHVLRHKQPLRAAIFVHPGDRVVTLADDGSARLWRAGRRDPKILREFPDKPGKGEAPPELPAIVGVWPSPDGLRTASAHEDGSVRRWLNAELEDDELFDALRGAVEPCLRVEEAERWLGAVEGVPRCEDADGGDAGPSADAFTFSASEGPGGWRKGKRMTAYKLTVAEEVRGAIDRVVYLMHESDEKSRARVAEDPEDGFEGVFRGFSCKQEVRVNIWLKDGRRLPTRSLDACALLGGGE